MRDCRTCCLRRIRCDRTEPNCLKCIGKGLSCPGYKRQIRWTNSIASRGKFKGLSAPTLELATQPASEETGGRGPIHSVVQPCDQTQIDDPPEEVMNQLIEYYSSELAPTNVWVHSPENGYTRLVIRLAHTQPALRFAILGLSAAHQNCGLTTEKSFSQKAHLKAIRLITDQLRTLTNMESSRNQTISISQQETPEAVLAAALVVCNHALLDSNTAGALFHLRATRTLIKSHLPESTVDNELFTFLDNQIASLDILACTTLFSPDLVKNPVMPKLDSGPVVFGHFLLNIHNITVMSVSPSGKPNDDCAFLQELEDQLELARASTFMAVGRLFDHSNDTHRHDTTLLVEAFHYAGLIYACRRLGAVKAKNIEDSHCSKLFRILAKAGNKGSYLPGLSWPIFIAGISCHRHNDRICFIRQLCHDLIRSSPFRYYSNIPRFLEELWKTADNDWISLAQAWENRGEPLLAM